PRLTGFSMSRARGCPSIRERINPTLASVDLSSTTISSSGGSSWSRIEWMQRGRWRESLRFGTITAILGSLASGCRCGTENSTTRDLRRIPVPLVAAAQENYGTPGQRQQCCAQEIGEGGPLKPFQAPQDDRGKQRASGLDKR